MELPVELGLPARFLGWRPGQGEIIEEVALSGSKHFLLDAPTGTGKSLIAIATYKKMQQAWQIMDRMLGREEQKHRCVYVTRTKQLQKQVLREFPEAKTLKGKNNYRCLKHPDKFPEFTAEHCPGSKKCVDAIVCPYLVDKSRALAASLAVLNEAYYLAEINGPGQFCNPEFVILDECDNIENSLMSFIQFTVSTEQLRRFGLELPDNPSSAASWRAWADRAYILLSNRNGDIQLALAGLELEEWADIEIEQQKSSTRIQSFMGKLQQFITSFDDTWVFTEEQTRDEWKWTFKPVLVANYAERYLWRHAQRYLGMSGTILDPQILAADIGLEEYVYKRLPSPFPVKHRPIYYETRPDGSEAHLCNITYKTKDVELPKLAAEITTILSKYPDQKVLIHTVSYAIQSYLISHLPPERLVTHDSGNREERLNYFRTSARPLVMLSPSFDRGVDLPDDACRCVIICKVPFLDLSDKQTKARIAMPGGDRWYALRAAQTIVQMSGRGVRGPKDYCDTYILDRNFGRLKFQMRNVLPKWWLEAIR